MFYEEQDVLIPILLEAGWMSNWWTSRDSSWSMTAKAEHEFTVYNIEITPKETPK